MLYTCKSCSYETTAHTEGALPRACPKCSASSSWELRESPSSPGATVPIAWIGGGSPGESGAGVTPRVWRGWVLLLVGTVIGYGLLVGSRKCSCQDGTRTTLISFQGTLTVRCPECGGSGFRPLMSQDVGVLLVFTTIAGLVCWSAFARATLHITGMNPAWTDSDGSHAGHRLWRTTEGVLAWGGTILGALALLVATIVLLATRADFPDGKALRKLLGTTIGVSAIPCAAHVVLLFVEPFIPSLARTMFGIAWFGSYLILLPWRLTRI